MDTAYMSSQSVLQMQCAVMLGCEIINCSVVSLDNNVCDACGEEDALHLHIESYLFLVK